MDLLKNSPPVVTEKSVTGRLKALQESEFLYMSAAIGFPNIKRRGFYLTLQNSEGEERLEFPKALSPPERDALLNIQVEYYSRHIEALDPMTGYRQKWYFRLQLLEGPYADIWAPEAYFEA